MAAEPNSAADESARTAPKTDKLETATFGSGCFWCTEAVFQQLNGVKSVVSGYSGGNVANPTYEAVCTWPHRPRRSDPSHVRPSRHLVRRPARTSSGRRTIPRRPTNKATTSARNTARPSSITTTTNAASPSSTKSSSTPPKRSPAPIVTEITPFKKFYPAEKYHQNYFKLNPGQSYCQFVIRPKVEKFNKEFKELIDKSK